MRRGDSRGVGVAAHGTHFAQAESAQRFDCSGSPGRTPPGIARTPSSARTAPRRSPRRPRRARVDAGVLRRALASPSSPDAAGLLARPAGPADRTRWSCARARRTTSRSAGTTAFALIADELRGAGVAGRGGLLHVGPHLATRRRSSTSCSCGRSAPTTCRTARTCATSRRGVGADRDRSASARASVIARGLRGRRPDLHRRPEPGHQPSAHALRAREGEAQRRAASSRSTRCPRPDCCGFNNPQKVARRARRGTAHRRRLPADPHRRRPGAVPGAGQAAARGRGRRARHRRSTTTSSPRTRAGFDDVRRAPRATSTWDDVVERDRPDDRRRSTTTARR